MFSSRSQRFLLPGLVVLGLLLVIGAAATYVELRQQYLTWSLQWVIVFGRSHPGREDEILDAVVRIEKAGQERIALHALAPMLRSRHRRTRNGAITAVLMFPKTIPEVVEALTEESQNPATPEWERKEAADVLSYIKPQLEIDR